MKDLGTIHLIGIGGIGMSSIAEVLINLGYKITGSDIALNKNVQRLQELGVKVYIGEDAKHLKDASIVVISSAIKNNNVELNAAYVKRIPVIRRADMLAELMRFKKSIAIGGTHGKTTTTSLISAILDNAKYDPTVVNGGIIEAYGSNARLGKGDWMVVEADESDGTFTRLPSTYVVVTNIDKEHLDFYGNKNNLYRAFMHFIENIPFYGVAFLCIDNADTQKLYKEIKYRKLVSYGFNNQANVKAINLSVRNGLTNFDVKIDGNEKLKNKIIKNISITMPGKHNVRNALASIALAIELGINTNIIKDTLKNFKGVERRFSIIGNKKGVTYIDDYAHHPTEILSVLEAAKSICEGKLIAIFEPHRYSRINNLFDEFSVSFHDADILFVTEIYEAGEKNKLKINKNKIINSILSAGHKDVRGLDNFNDLLLMLENITNTGDYVIFLGAGSISRNARKMVEQIIL
ncbi:MAG: UDP-N-acetylmuramate--L-alanine ligase [Pelagibacterales bacterium]|nr:UDP-N-acetylmuramate--L-alanine ligase [Pelagibacterales bacterium]